MSLSLPTAARAAVLVAAKDLRVEARSRSVLQGMVFYAAIAVLLFGFALGPDSETLRRLAPGMLWLAVALASLLAVGRSFAAEREQGTLDALLLYPVPRESVLAGKALASLALLLAVAGSASILMLILYSLPVTAGGVWALAVGVLLGCAGLAVAGTLYGAVAAHLAAREALMPMLLLPLLVPLLIATTEITAAALDGELAARWLALLGAFDLVLVALSTAVFSHLLEG